MAASIRGLQEAQQANLRMIAAMTPGGRFGNTIRTITTKLQRYEVSVSHVDTGAMRASERIEIKGLVGRIFLDESATNPRSGALTSVYGAIENARGGAHAFGARTYETAPGIVNSALNYFADGLR